jgi:subtilisin
MIVSTLLSAGLLSAFSTPQTSPASDPLASHEQAEQITLLVTYFSRPGTAELEWVEQNLGGTVKYRYQLIPTLAITIPVDQIEAVQNRQGVQLVEQDGMAQITDINNTWGVKRIGGGFAHDAGQFGAGIKVGVIDTGVDYNHPELSGIYMGGHDFVNNDTDPMDDHFHGTHVSGTIAAKLDGTGVVGVAPNIELYAIKGFNSAGGGDYSDLIACVEWVTINDMDVVNNSWIGFSPPVALHNAFDVSKDMGVIHICAAGNFSGAFGVLAPARYSSTYAVSALDSANNLAGFSDRGPEVDFCAPGVDILSVQLGGGYVLASGTSMATPHACGTAALALGTGTITDTNADGILWDEVMERMAATAIDLGPAGKDNRFGNGMVNAQAVLMAPMGLTASALTAGARAGVQADGATPGNAVTFVYSVAGTDPFPVDTDSVLLGVGWPHLMGSQIADATGMATFTFRVPMGTSGSQVWFQAIDANLNSSTVATTTIQ